MRRILQVSRWNDGIAQYGEKAESKQIGKNQNNHGTKTITQLFNEALHVKTEQKMAKRFDDEKLKLDVKRLKVDTGAMGVPHLRGYVPRFNYNGYLKKCTWIPFDENKQPNQFIRASKQEKEEYFHRTKEKVCLLMAFTGQNYFGMQYNGRGVETIEKHLFNAMVKNRWILPEHIRNLESIGFEHGSRTDAGVSAARMYCSLTLRE